MIQRIDLRWFKCFEHLTLPTAPLTMLSGTNASGKSTLFQALVLLHQTMQSNEWAKRLLLNGPLLELGTAGDVIDKTHGRHEFQIGVITERCSIHWDFHSNEDRNAMSIGIKSVRVNGKVQASSEDLSGLRFFVPRDPHSERLAEQIRGISYLTAERTGPRATYELQDPDAIQVVGPRGDNAVGMLHQQREKKILQELVTEPLPTTLLSQVGNRMRQFFPGTTIDVQKVENTNLVRLAIRTSDATSFHRPTHVGFGLTQVFPIIVAALAASKDDLLLIENPEVHLHPAGQAMMGGFLSDVAAAGVQVLVETHSDHLLNGIRRAVKANRISPNAVKLHFLRSRDEAGAQVTSPNIDEAGNIDEWPDGFFDQFDKDMNHFADWG